MSLQSFEIPSSPQLLEEPAILTALKSDSAFEMLSQRLKHSLKTCDEFVLFLNRKVHNESRFNKETQRAVTHCQHSIGTNLFVVKGTIPSCLQEIIKYDDKIFNVRESYIKGLQTISNELVSIVQHFTVLRKQLKEKGSRVEREVQDAIAHARKARNKYGNLCSDMEKLVNVDRDKSKITLQGRKTVSEQQDFLKAKIKDAENDYQKKAHGSQRLKNQLVDVHRPKISKSWKELIVELDNALEVQIEKYSIYTESLFIGVGNSISPINGQDSMRKVSSNIDVEKALYINIKGTALISKEVFKPVEFVRHPLYGSSTLPNPSITVSKNSNAVHQPSKLRNVSNTASIPISESNKPLPSLIPNNLPAGVVVSGDQLNYSTLDPTHGTPASTLNGPRPLEDKAIIPILDDTSSIASSLKHNLFGLPLENLQLNDEAVPLFVLKCIENIEKYGFNTQGVYRMSPNKITLDDLSHEIDQDPSDLSILDPVDIDNVGDDYIFLICSLFKKFFSQLPEPLLTFEQRDNFLQASLLGDAQNRKARLHQFVYELPDCNYFTLKDLLKHFINLTKMPALKMDAKNLSIVWAGNILGNEAVTKEELDNQQRVLEDLIEFAEEIFTYEENDIQDS